jgi:hypothetical protein
VTIKNAGLVCLQKFGERLGPIQRTIEDVNDQTALFTSNNVLVSHINLNRLEDLNTRYVKLSVIHKKFLHASVAVSGSECPMI